MIKYYSGVGNMLYKIDGVRVSFWSLGSTEWISTGMKRKNIIKMGNKIPPSELAFFIMDKEDDLKKSILALASSIFRNFNH